MTATPGDPQFTPQPGMSLDKPAGYSQPGPDQQAAYSQPGYGQPGFEQPGHTGYGQPVHGQQPGAPVTPEDERLWATLAHVGPLIVGILAPLIVYLMYKDRSAFVRDQAAQALNFQILGIIGIFVSTLLTLVIIGWLMLPVVLVLMIVFPIMGAMSANRGQRYVYPMTPTMIS